MTGMTKKKVQGMPVYMLIPLILYKQKMNSTKKSDIGSSFESKQETVVEKRFQRRLNTNYKYSCLVTLTLNLIKQHGLDKLSKKLACQNSFSNQKTYIIVVLRVALLINSAKDYKREEIVNKIIYYFLANYEQLIQQKFQNSIGSPVFLKEIKKKCASDIDVFKRVFQLSKYDIKEITQILLDLYPKEGKIMYPKHYLQAERLAKIFVGVCALGQAFSFERLDVCFNSNCETNCLRANCQFQSMLCECLNENSDQNYTNICESMRYTRSMANEAIGKQRQLQLLQLKDNKKEKIRKQSEETGLTDLIEVNQIEKFVREGCEKIQLQDIIMLRSAMTLHYELQQAIHAN